MESVLCLWDLQAVFCPFRAGVNCCVQVQVKVISVNNTLPFASFGWFVYNHFFSLQGTDDASAMGPSELILTRGSLNEEEEERESDTDDIDHEGKGRRPESCTSSQEIPSVFHCLDGL